MENLTKKTIESNSRGMTYTYYTSSPETVHPSLPTLLLVHGFPDEAHMWSQIASYLSGYRLIIPDMLGYAGTSKPGSDPSLYRYKLLTQDLVDILDAESVSRVVSVGHDWGSDIAQRLYLWHPDRVCALVMVNLAYLPPDPTNPVNVERTNKMTEQVFGYQMLAYQEFLAAERAPGVLAQHTDRLYDAMHAEGKDSMKELFGMPNALENHLTGDGGDSKVQPRAYATADPAMKERFVNRFQRDGWVGPVNYYRAFHSDVNRLDEVQSLTPDRFVIKVPAFFVACTQDAVCRPELIGTALDKGLLPDFDSITIDCAHWSPLEKPKEVAEGIDGFVKKKFGTVSA